jgi:hypothetical protein
VKHSVNNDRCKFILATLVIIFSTTLPNTSHSQSTQHRFDPAQREPLMRASVAVELIPSANAEDITESAESLSQQEEDLKKMEAELLKALDGSSKEISARDAGDSRKIADIAPPDPTSAPKMGEPKAFPIANVPTEKPLQEIKKQLVTTSQPSVKPQVKSSQSSARPQKIEATYESASDLSQKLAIAESQVKILSRELDLSQRSLSSAEERIDELSSLVKSSQPSRVAGAPTDRGSLNTQAIPAEDSDDYAVEGPSRKGITQKTTGPAVVPHAIDYNQYDHSLRDSSIATIVTDKAPLRVGPGKQESAMYTLPRLSAVTIEYRSGEWYRIITNGGLRGWVYGSSLRFDTGVSPVSTVRVGGVRANYEPVSFK